MRNPQDLEEATRKYLAWESILAEREPLNIDPQQVKQAETQRSQADSVVKARIPETYQWLLVPEQKSPQHEVKWQAYKLTGQDALAVRASKKLRNDELLLTVFASTRLRMELDKVPLWRGNHVPVKQLAEDFARYLYLPRLRDSSVLIGAIRDGMTLLTWQRESFAYADSFDESTGRYRGLRRGQGISLADTDLAGLLVKGDVARAQIDAETDPASPPTEPGGAHFGGPAPGPAGRGEGTSPGAPNPIAVQPKRFHGAVTLDTARVGRDAGRIAEEVIAHLAGLLGATVTVTLEIEAVIPSGAPDHVVRTVTENSRTLKFTSQGFEVE